MAADELDLELVSEEGPCRNRGEPEQQEQQEQLEHGLGGGGVGHQAPSPRQGPTIIDGVEVGGGAK